MQTIQGTSSEVREAYEKRVSDRDREPSVDTDFEPRLNGVIRYLGRAARENPNYDTIRSDMIDPVVAAYGFSYGHGFDKQMEFLLSKSVRPFEIAFFFRNYDEVMGRVEESFEPDGCDFVDKVWDIVDDYGRVNENGRGGYP